MTRLLDTRAALLRACRDHPGERTPVLLLADHLDETDQPDAARWVRNHGLYALPLKGGDFGFDDGGDGFDDGGDGFDDGGGFGDGGDFGDDGGDGDTSILEAIGMKDGLNIVCTPGGYSPYIRIGWFRRIDFELVGRNVRVIRRLGRSMEISQLARNGPRRGDGHTILLSPSPEGSVALAMCAWVEPCDPAAWAEDCPEPEGW